MFVSYLKLASLIQKLIIASILSQEHHHIFIVQYIIISPSQYARALVFIVHTYPTATFTKLITNQPLKL